MFINSFLLFLSILLLSLLIILGLIKRRTVMIKLKNIQLISLKNIWRMVAKITSEGSQFNHLYWKLKSSLRIIGGEALLSHGKEVAILVWIIILTVTSLHNPRATTSCCAIDLLLFLVEITSKKPLHLKVRIGKTTTCFKLKDSQNWYLLQYIDKKCLITFPNIYWKYETVPHPFISLRGSTEVHTMLLKKDLACTRLSNAKEAPPPCSISKTNTDLAIHLNWYSLY